ncbi:hypothetical protein HRbin19_01413 [bacterium HR19]|nr:hypothetical protein HRbin19_01413 [bacterium HR19]
MKMAEKGIAKVSILKTGLLAFSLALGALFACAKEEKHVPDYGIKAIQQDGKTIAQPGADASSLIQQGKFEDLRKNVCGTNGCSDELKTYANEPTINAYVTVMNIMILFKRLDSALSTICGLAGSNLGSICPSSSAPYQKVSITPKQTDVIDTLLNFVGLKRDEITQLMTEVAIATENYIKRGDQNFVFEITVPFDVKVGNLINVWFKPGTQVRWDHINILGAVAQLVLAVFNTINSHDWNLDIGGIISNVSKLLGDLSNDPAGFIRRIPETLGIHKAPDFLRFKQDGDRIWEQIPGNISNALTWAGQGLEYFFANPCKDNDPALACWQRGATSLEIRFNLDTTKENKFMGNKATGVLTLLKGGFSDQTDQALVAILKNGGDKFNCSKDNNVISVVGGPTEFDIQKVVNAVGSLIQGFSISVALPNFARIDVCKLFGAKMTQPKPIRDLLFPVEVNPNNDGTYTLANTGVQFAIEVEASKNFYLKALTLGGAIYKAELTSVGLGNLYIVTNHPWFNPWLNFVGEPTVPTLPYQPPATADYSSNTTEIFVSATTTYNGIGITFYVIQVPNGIDHIFANFITFVPLLQPNDFLPPGLTFNTVAVIAPKKWVKGDYVARGDGNRFEKVKNQNGNSLELKQDFVEPLTTFVYAFKWNSNYPEDVVSSLGAILSDIGMKFLIYVLFKDPSFNSSLELDVCSVFYTVAKGLYDRYTTTNDQKVKGAIEYIFYSLIYAQEEGRTNVWGNCNVIAYTDNKPTGISAPQPNQFRIFTDIVQMNQLVNDLLGLGLFGIAASNVK